MPFSPTISILPPGVTLSRMDRRRRLAAVLTVTQDVQTDEPACDGPIVLRPGRYAVWNPGRRASPQDWDEAVRKGLLYGKL